MSILVAVNAGPLVWVSCFGTSQSFAMINLSDPSSQEKLSTRFDDQMFCIQRRKYESPTIRAASGRSGWSCWLSRLKRGRSGFLPARETCSSRARSASYMQIADQLADLRQCCSAGRWKSIFSTTGDGWGDSNAGHGVLRALSV